MISASRNFYNRGWMLGTSGNLSNLINKDPLEFLITVSGKDKGELEEKDFILVDKDGVQCHSESFVNTQDKLREESHTVMRSFVANAPQDDMTICKPSAETLLHSAIYNSTNANAVFHVHTTNSTLLSIHSKNNPEVLTFSGLEMIKGLGFKTHEINITIPVIENSQDMKYLAEIAPAYTNEMIPGLILRGHGIYAWGKTLQETKRHVEIFEFLFEYRVKELSIK